MADEAAITLLEKDIGEKLNLVSDHQNQTNTPEVDTPSTKKRRKKKKVSADQNHEAESSQTNHVTDKPEATMVKNASKEEPVKRRKWTTEYANWVSQRDKYAKEGLLPTVYLFPEPQMYADESEKKQTPQKKSTDSKEKSQLSKPTNHGPVNEAKIEVSRVEKNAEKNVKQTPQKKPPNSIEKSQVPVPKSNRPPKEVKAEIPKDREDKTVDSCPPSQPPVKVTVLTNQNRHAEPKQFAKKSSTTQDERLHSSKSSDAGECAASPDAMAACKEKPPKLNAEKEPPEQEIPEGCVQLVIKSPVSPKPKKKRKAKDTEKSKETDEERNKSPQTDEDEAKNRAPARVLKVIVPKEDLVRYRNCGILPLKHINEKFPRAFFHCRLCSFHVSNLPETERHLKDPRHLRLQAMEQRKQTAALMPMPSEEIREAIGELIQTLYECSCITDKELEVRLDAFHYLQKTIEQTFPGYSIRLYGSTFSGLGLKHSDVNVSLVFCEPKDEQISGLMIINIYTWLQSNPVWANIVEDFACRVPIIRFVHQQLSVPFTLIIDGESSYKTSCLLKEYRKLDPRFAVLTVALRTFARICGLDRPDYGSLPPHAFTLMVLQYLQQVKVLPVLHTSGDSDAYLSAEEFQPKIDSGEWKPEDKTLGFLWLGMLRYYAFKFSYNDRAICVRSFDPLARSVKNWGSRRLAIEDPFHLNVNLAGTMTTTETHEFFLECMSNLYSFFWVPQTTSGPLFTQLVLPGVCTDVDPLVMTPAEAKDKMNLLKKEDLKWDFKPEKILGSKQLPLTCSVCNAIGHSKHNCPELEVPPAGNFPPPELAHLALLDQVCYNIFRNFCQTDNDIRVRETIRRELEQYIRTEYPDAVLTLFGSSCNGFGFLDSDMDVCMTFQSNIDGNGVDFAAIVRKLGKMLRRNRTLNNIIPITSAKVPIVKMLHRASRLEADISLYNTLGRRNSQLLATYAAIDPRVRILGYMAKLLAKQCDIGDASRGTLSSYAYTLMVLFYLQQINPPVIPVLQEITVAGVDRTKYIVEGRDTWFFEDMPNLYRVWPHRGANRESPSTLWLGFLRYYADIFNYRQQVVCIRQSKPLFRLEKMWTERFMAIEDPFDLSHNLGSGLSLRMGVYIRKVFVKAWKVFHTPVRTVPTRFTCLEEYLFNPRVLMPSAPPPNDRGCNICGRIGHKVRDCDRNRHNKNRRQESDDDSDDEPRNQVKPAQREDNQNGRRPAGPRNQPAHHQAAPRNYHQGPPNRHNTRPMPQTNRQRSTPQNWRAGQPGGPPQAQAK